MKALGDKLSFQVSDFLTAKISFNEERSFYTLTSRGMASPNLKLKLIHSIIGNSVSFTIGLPIQDADKMLKKSKIRLVPEHPNSSIKQLELVVETIPK